MAHEDGPRRNQWIAAVSATLSVARIRLKHRLQVGDGFVGVLTIDIWLGRQVPDPAAHPPSDACLIQTFHHIVHEPDGASF